ncbi:MAG TPA: hypothetical protein DEG28_01010 [Porphyromonadaceae bacterium]|nr:hypothetical protein [Porphyromonadaceae bacterium]HBX44461.1 hypothetical protein [Porphyromonadaceae bacterium]
MIMINEVSKKTGIPVNDLLGKSRKHEVSCVRQLYYKLLKEKTGFSTAKVAELCSRNHATVLYGIRKVNDMLQIGDKYAVRMWNKIKDLEA